MNGLLYDIETLIADQLDLTHLTSRELVRIEKQLKAQAKLDDSLNLNEVQQILSILKKQGEGLSLLYEKEYAVLREILKHPESGYCIGFQPIKIKETHAQIVDLLSRGFPEDLKRYVDSCLNNNHFTGLYALLQYVDFLDIQLKEVIISGLKDKLTYAAEILHIQSIEKTELRLEAVMNPYLYRCLNLLGALEFEKHIHDLLDGAIAYKWNADLIMHILFAMGSYQAINEGLNEVIRSNHAVAYEKGIREKNFNSVVQGKGETFKRSSFDQRSYEESNRPREKSGDSGNDGAVLAKIAGFILFIGFMIFRLSNSNSNSNHNSTYDYDFSSIIENNNFGSPTYHSNYGSNTDDEFVETINYLHGDSIAILESEATHFGYHLADYFDMDNLAPYPGKPEHVKVYNDTKDDLILFFQGDKKNKKMFLFLSPNNFDWIHNNLSGMRIYAGSNPEIVQYKKDSTEIFPTEKLRWKDFNEENRTNFNVYHKLKVKLYHGQKKELRIQKENGEYSINLKEIPLFENIDL